MITIHISEPEEKTSSRKTQRFKESSQSTSSVFEFSPDTINAPAEGKSRSIVKVTCSGEWQANASKYADWIHIDKANETLLGVTCDQNSTGKTRTGHVYISANNEEKSICITQASLPRSSRAWIWILVLILAVIGTGIGIGIHNQREQEQREIQALFNRHTNAINDFDRYLNAASTDNIDALQQALDQLRIIEQVEDDRRFDGTYRYSSRRQSLQKKTQELYDIVDRRYQLAPPDSQAEKRNLNKRRQLFEFKKKI